MQYCLTNCIIITIFINDALDELDEMRDGFLLSWREFSLRRDYDSYYSFCFKTLA